MSEEKDETVFNGCGGPWNGYPQCENKMAVSCSRMIRPLRGVPDHLVSPARSEFSMLSAEKRVAWEIAHDFVSRLSYSTVYDIENPEWARKASLDTC